MENLKQYDLLLVGDIEDKNYFEAYFQEVYLRKSNAEAFHFYTVYKPLIIFFYCDKRVFDTLSIIKKIREHDRETIVVIILKEKKISLLLNAIHLHLSGYIQKPFQRESVTSVLQNIIHDLDLLYEYRVRLKDNYSFNRKSKRLSNREDKEIKLTKNERKLMLLLSSHKEQYLSLEQIEYTIWEEASANEDCKKRLKALLYGLRRKLPQKTIINAYGFGYKLVSE
jgi:DNA-binding response OmpR family regulator